MAREDHGMVDSLSRMNDITMSVIVLNEDVARVRRQNAKLQVAPNLRNVKKLRRNGTQITEQLYNNVDVSTERLRPLIPKAL